MSSSCSSVTWRVDRATRQSSVEALNAFLRSSRSSCLCPSPLSLAVHVCVGNEAADADSIVSSLAYAFVCTQQQNKLQKQQSESETLHVAVLPITRAEFPLRCDVAAMFQALAIDTAALVFVDEFPWSLSGRVMVTLLDHNALSNKKLLPWRDQLEIQEIVDHHSDLGHHREVKKRDVAFANGQALVASTCTLVAEKMDAAVVRHPAYPVLSTMLLGVIALDSINFDPKAKRVTSRDVQAAQQLKEKAFATKEELFTWLQAEKFNVERWKAFTLADCLRVDYKEFEFGTAGNDVKRVGISAVLVDIEAFVRKVDDAVALRNELSAFCKQNDLAFVLVMSLSMTSDNQRQRQLLFFQETGNEVKRCLAFFESDGFLLLTPLQLPQTHSDEHVAAFSQLNVEASRKQVAPLIQRALVECQVVLQATRSAATL
uniref:DHHA2 domain-containing protein n=1 Tax=Peronospora matthiolae TaxID=2874970 RepID=A0AAV1VB57_9STRA